eukprot:c17513_g1_i2 orf=190-1242(+)
MDAEAVRASSAWVVRHASHVSINPSGIEKVLDQLGGNVPMIRWDFEGIHYFDDGPLTVQYLLVLDALNFCFWPDGELEYDHLAAGLTRALLADKSVFSASRLKRITGLGLRKMLGWPKELPLEDERARLLQEVGIELEKNFEGQAANLVTSANGSAVTLVKLVTRHFPAYRLYKKRKKKHRARPLDQILVCEGGTIYRLLVPYHAICAAGFRDHSVYKGHQIFLYKRAQIFVGDLWGAFKGQGFGAFRDIGAITMFADNFVPAVLRHLGILSYSSSLSSIVDACKELPSGSEEEVEIRACAIIAVEKLRELLRYKFGKEILSVQLDWWLWSSGKPSDEILPYHRTKTIYY